VTPKIVSIGGTFPFSGPASSYAPIPIGMQAYFSYVNAKKTNGKRGVFGRQIKFNAVIPVRARGASHLPRARSRRSAVAWSMAD
jgi:hypothetical protein